MTIFELMVRKKYLADGKTVDEDKDGKGPAQRSAAAKKAARTRKRNRGNQTKIRLEIDNTLLDGLDKLIKLKVHKSRDGAISTAIGQYLLQMNILKNG